MVKKYHSAGFTIVELLIVIVVIAILAAITIVAYNGIQQRAVITKLNGSLSQGVKLIKLYEAKNGAYPTSLSQVNEGQGMPSSDVTYGYIASNMSFCLSASSNSTSYSVTQSSNAVAGDCVTANKALGILVTGSGITNNWAATDGDYGSPYNYAQHSSAGLSSVTLDLGAIYTISTIKVWHYYPGTRTYNNTKTEVSSDGSTWYTIFDSTVSGTYQETSTGKSHTFSPRGVRYIQDWANGSNVNASSHWIEIQAF